MVPTPWHTIGPLLPRAFFQEGDNDLTRGTARSPRIILRGRVLEEGGRPCVKAVLEAWQADADLGFLGWGRAWTDGEGRYSFHTVFPGGFVDGAGVHAPQVNLLLIGSPSWGGC